MSSVMIDPENAFTDVCQPFTEVPAWWSGFLFHVLSARQVTLYMYLNMLGDAFGVCSPTARQIRSDLGLASLTIVFESLSVLELRGFILRERRVLPGHPSRRNVYQRPSCEFTVLRLLQDSHLNGKLCPVARLPDEMSAESRRLTDDWLRRCLAADYGLYASTPDGEKRAVLIHLLRQRLRLS